MPFQAAFGALRRMGPARRALVLEAGGWLVLFWLVLRIAPFPAIAKRLGRMLAPAAAAHGLTVSAQGGEARRLAQDIGWVVTRAAGRAPFRAVCLHQALAARMMLRRRGVPSALHFGVRKPGPGSTSAVEAHAWLDTAEVQVTGYPVAERFVEIACFI
jgi:hypothetical protein